MNFPTLERAPVVRTELKGRHGHGTDEACSGFEGRLHLRRVPINFAGRDSGGAFWGHDFVWRAITPDGSCERFTVAANRNDAIGYLRKTFPKAVINR